MKGRPNQIGHGVQIKYGAYKIAYFSIPKIPFWSLFWKL